MCLGDGTLGEGLGSRVRAQLCPSPKLALGTGPGVLGGVTEPARSHQRRPALDQTQPGADGNAPTDPSSWNPACSSKELSAKLCHGTHRE